MKRMPLFTGAQVVAAATLALLSPAARADNWVIVNPDGSVTIRTTTPEKVESPKAAPKAPSKQTDVKSKDAVPELKPWAEDARKSATAGKRLPATGTTTLQMGIERVAPYYYPYPQGYLPQTIAPGTYRQNYLQPYSQPLPSFGQAYTIPIPSQNAITVIPMGPGYYPAPVYGRPRHRGCNVCSIDPCRCAGAVHTHPGGYTYPGAYGYPGGYTYPGTYGTGGVYGYPGGYGYPGTYGFPGSYDSRTSHGSFSFGTGGFRVSVGGSRTHSTTTSTTTIFP